MIKIGACGNLTADPKQYDGTTQAGKAYTKVEFTLACRTRKKDKTEFIKCIAWGKLGTGVIMPWAKKGTYATISGDGELDKWEGDKGTMANIEVTLTDFELGPKGSGQATASTNRVNPPESTVDPF